MLEQGLADPMPGASLPAFFTEETLHDKHYEGD